MSIYRGAYYPATSCKPAARPGTDALVSWYLGAYLARGARNLGTYSCKRLGSGWSVHAERRAADLGTSPYGGNDSVWGWALANALRLNSAELGVQLIILGRKVWSCRYPDSGWRAYTGEYHGHMHTELIPSASQNLTVAKIQRTIGGGLSVADVDKILNAIAAVDRKVTALADAQAKDVVNANWNNGRVEAISQMLPEVRWGPGEGQAMPMVKMLTEIHEDVAALRAAMPPAEEDEA